MYNVDRVVELAEYALSNTNLDVLLAPVWVPRVNDYEIPKIISLAKRLGAGRNCPPLGIQKYEAHKFGRKPKGVKEMTWWKFYRQLEEWEKEFDVKLKLGPHDFGIHKRKTLPYVFKKGERVKVRIIAPGWMRKEMIGVAKNRCITVVNCDANPGDLVNVVVLENKHNIYISKQV